MKTKKSTHSQPKCVVNQTSKQRITKTTLSKLGMNLGKMMDLMHDPSVKDETFSQIYTETQNSIMLSASNEELFISLTIERKGAIK